MPPLLDNNLAINTAQGRVAPRRAAPTRPPSNNPPPPPGRPQGTPTCPWLQPQAGLAGCERRRSHPPSRRQESSRAGHTGQPLSRCPRRQGGLAAPTPVWLKASGTSRLRGGEKEGSLLVVLWGPAYQCCCSRWGATASHWPGRCSTGPGAQARAGQAACSTAPPPPTISPSAPRPDSQREGKNAPKRII